MMFRMMLVVMFTVWLWGRDDENMLQKIRMIGPLTYHDLYVKYFQTSPIKSEIEDWYRVALGDSQSVAIDFKTVNVIDMVKQTSKYTVLYYNNEDFDIYAIWIEHKTLQVKDVLLLAFRYGTGEWQTEREVIDKMTPRNPFLLKEEWRDTEWIVPHIKGDILIGNQRYYSIGSNDKGFIVESFNAEQCYQKEDKKLNRLYRETMKKLHPKERKALQQVQRAWAAYKQKKCSLFLMNATHQDPKGDYAKLYRYNCLFRETRHRNKSLGKMHEYFDFYR